MYYTDNRGYRCIKHCRKCSYFDFYKAKCGIGRVNYEMRNEEKRRINPDLSLGIRVQCNKKSEVDKIMELVNEALKNKWK